MNNPDDLTKREVVADARDVRGDARDVRGDKRDSTADKREEVTAVKAEKSADRLGKFVNLFLLVLLINMVLGGVGIARNISTNNDVDKLQSSVGVLTQTVKDLDEFARQIGDNENTNNAELQAVFDAVFDIRAAVCAESTVPDCEEIATEIIMTRINEGGE